MANITRIKNNQISDNTVEFQKLKDGTLTGSKFNANLTLNSNVTILGNLTVANSFAQLNSINTYINDPVVVFNNNYVGSPTYDIGILVNRNLSSLDPYGAVNAAFVWKEADTAFEALMTTETGTTAGSINNSGWANIKVGNLTAITGTFSGGITAPSLTVPVINATSGNITTLSAPNFSSANAVISGGYISSLANITVTDATVTTGVVTNFSSGNIRVSGGYISALANATITLATITTGNINTLNTVDANVTTLSAPNFSSGNIRVSGGYLTGLANVYATTGVTTNFSTGNAVITGGYMTGLANVYATTGVTTNFSTGNAVITGGYMTGLANVYATTGYFDNLSSPNLVITSESVTTLVATNFSSGNAVISGGYISALANATITTGVTTNFSTGNARITGGYADNFPIGANTAATGAFTTLTASGATTLTNATESTTSSTGAVIVSGGVGIAKNLNVGGSVVVTGNLTVQGTTTTVNSTTVDVADLNITVAKGAASAAAADGGGLTVDGANATLLYTNSTNSWNVNKQFIGLGASFSNTTPSTSATTGALVVSGGVGIAGDVYAYRVNATYGNITTGYFGSLNTANAVITGGYVSGLANIASTYGTFTNLSTGNAVITGGYMSGLANVATTYLTTTNLSTPNAVVTGGSINNSVIGNATPAAATFTQLNTTGAAYIAGNIVANANTPSTSTTTGAIVITGTGGLGVGGNINAGVYNTSLHNIQGNVLLGLGTTQANDSELTINLNTQDPIPSNAIVHVSGSPNKDAFYGMDAFGTGIPRVALRRAKGTPASPTAVQTNDSIGSFSARGYGATGYVTSTTQSSLQFHANENFTDTAQGTYATISVVPDGAIVPIYGMVIGGNGTVVMVKSVSSTDSTNGTLVVKGGAGIGENLNVAGNVAINGFLDVTSPAIFENTGKFYGNLVANSSTNSTSISTGALVVVGGAGIASNVNIGGATVLNANGTAGYDTIVKGVNDSTLVWARPSATYDQVLIGNSASVSTLVRGAKLAINSTDSMLLPTGTTAQRPSNTGGTDVTGMFRFNTTLGYIEFYTGTEWNGVTTQFTVITDEQFTGDGSTTDFTLGGATSTAGTIVSINGVMQIPTLAYSIVDETTLRFTEAPLSTDVIDVRRLTTTQSITSIASLNGYMGLVCDNTGANITTGTSSATVTTSFEPNGAQVSYVANVSVASANTPTTIDTIDNTKYRTGKYVVQITHGADYQAQEVLVVSDGTTASVVTYGVVQTNGNLGVVSATQSGTNTLIQFIAANSSSTVRIKKDYLAI